MLPVSGVAAPPPARGEGYPGAGLNPSAGCCWVLLGAAAVGCCCSWLALLLWAAAVGCCCGLLLRAAATAAAAAAAAAGWLAGWLAGPAA